MSLDTYVPEVRAVTVGGKEIAVSPLRVRQIPAFTKAILPAAPLILSNQIAAAVALHGDELAQAITVATGESADFIGKLLADEFLDLVLAVVKVNSDFFARRVLPKLEALNGTPMPTNGATSSPSSLPTDTA